MERILTELVDRLTKAYGGTLVSVVLYGSAASPEGKDQLSDFNVLCVLQQITVAELQASQGVFRWWREMKNPSPLLLSLAELARSTDSFPIEFHDIKENHRILFGEDVIGSLAVSDVFYRAQVEHELRAKLLRLRQKAAGILSERDMLLRLMADSLSTFCVLLRHVLRLAGQAVKPGKREVLTGAQQHFGLDLSALLTLADMRENRIKPRSVEPLSLFPQYLSQVQAVVDAVDRMER